MLLAVAAIAPPALWAVGRRGLSIAALVAGRRRGARHRLRPLPVGAPATASTRGASGTPPPTAPRAGWTRPRRSTPAASRRPSADVELVFTFLLASLAWLLVAWRRPLLAVGVGFAAFAVPSTMVRDGRRLRPLAAVPDPGRADPGRLRPAGAAAARVGRPAGDGRGRLRDRRRADPVGRRRACARTPSSPGGRGTRWPAARRGSASGYVWNQDYQPFKWPKKKTEVFEVTAPSRCTGRRRCCPSSSTTAGRRTPSSQQVYSDGTPKSIEVPGRAAAASSPTRTRRICARRRSGSRGWPIRTCCRPASRWPTPWTPPRRSARPGRHGVAAARPGQGRDLHGPGLRARPDAEGARRDQHRLPVGTSAGHRDRRHWIPRGTRRRRGSGLQLPIDPSYVDGQQPGVATVGRGRGRDAVRGRRRRRVVLPRPAAVRLRPDAELPAGPPGAGRLHAPRARRLLPDVLGSMALVLRMHGIPARVAVGFTSGTPTVSSSNTYEVSDRNAHSWVEVWFAGYGWLPFEPTPGRVLTSGRRPRRRTPSSCRRPQVSGLTGAAGAAVAQYTARGAAQRHDPREGPRHQPRARRRPRRQQGVFLDAGRRNKAAASSAGCGRGRDRAGSLLLAKWAAVRLRYLRRGPRAQASAAFAESRPSPATRE